MISGAQQVVGGERASREILGWIRGWRTRQGNEKGLVLVGPPGIGKTRLVSLVCEQGNLHNVYKVDVTCKNLAKELRGAEQAFTARKVEAYMTGRMQRSKMGAVLLDDLDAVSDLSPVQRFIRSSKVPVICVCNEVPWDIVGECKLVRMQRLPIGTVAAVLEKQAPPGTSKASILRVAEASGGDLRQAMNELRFYGTFANSATVDSGDKTLNPFDVLPGLFRGERCPESCDHAMMGYLAHENYPRTASWEHMAESAEAISLADSLPSALPADMRAYMSVELPCAIARSQLAGKVFYPTIVDACRPIPRAHPHPRAYDLPPECKCKSDRKRMHPAGWSKQALGDESVPRKRK